MNQKFIKPPAKSIVLKKLYKIIIISITTSQQSLRLFEFNLFLPSRHSKKKLPYRVKNLESSRFDGRFM